MRRPAPNPRYLEAITTNPDLDTSFVLMDGAGIGHHAQEAAAAPGPRTVPTRRDGPAGRGVREIPGPWGRLGRDRDGMGQDGTAGPRVLAQGSDWQLRQSASDTRRP